MRATSIAKRCSPRRRSPCNPSAASTRCCHRHHTGIDPYADLELRPVPRLGVAVDLLHQSLDGDAGTYRVGRVVAFGIRSAEDGHQSIAKIFVECSEVIEDDLGHASEEL